MMLLKQPFHREASWDYFGIEEERRIIDTIYLWWESCAVTETEYS